MEGVPFSVSPEKLKATTIRRTFPPGGSSAADKKTSYLTEAANENIAQLF
jgi:hypothetical protein